MTKRAKLVPNKTFLRGYAFTLGLGSMQLPFAMTGGASLADIYQSFFGWSEDELVFWNTVISSSAVVGLIIGSLLGGKLILKGRRRATLVIQAMAIFGSLLTMFKSLIMICTGRVILGFVGSCACLIMGKSIGETLPSSMNSQYGMLTNIFINFGFMLSFLVGLLLPTDPAEFATDEMWKVVSAMPAIFGIFTISLWSLVFTEEPVAYSIANNRNTEAKRLLTRVYSNTEVYYKSQKSDSRSDKENQTEAEKVSAKKQMFKEEESNDDLYEKKLSMRRSKTLISDEKEGYFSVICGVKYRRATTVCFFINLFN